MKKTYILSVILLLCGMGLFAQSTWLAPEAGYKTADILSDKAFSCHAILGNNLYAIDSDGLYCYDLTTMEQTHNYGKAPDYNGWVSFVTADPDGTKLWLGYTVTDLTDDRIFSVDIATGTWTHVATFPGNFDMEIADGNYYVSGLNTEGWDGVNDVNCISLLDQTGNNKHKKLIEIGGNSTGLSIDTKGNVYNAKYDPSGNTFMYQWKAADVANVIAATDGSFLTLNEGTVISSMPGNGPYDCATDDAGNLLFNCNDFTGGSFLAVWNGNTGDAQNYEKIGTYGGSSYAWFAMLKATGDITKDGKAYMINYGDAIAEIHLDYPPVVSEPLGTVMGYTGNQIQIDLNNHFSDADDTDPFVYEVLSNSYSEAISASVTGNTLSLDLIANGQTEIVIQCTSNGQTVTDKLIVGSYSKPSGSYSVVDFEDLTLANENYWNGSDGSGRFNSGMMVFENEYTAAWGSWSKWAYSNTSDTTTPGDVNQYSAITGLGMDATSGKSYAVSYAPTVVSTIFNDNSTHYIEGFYVTNSTYATLSMEQGDSWTKKFGGADGNDPDYYKLIISGWAKGVETATVEFYLADFRFADNSKDYIIKTWQWVDLSSLGKVDDIQFSLESSDEDPTWGMNNPAYFCADNFYITPDQAPEVDNAIADVIEKVNVSQITIDLSNVFTDTDDNDADIVKTVKANTNETLLSASVTNNTLILSVTKDKTGEAELTIEAESNGKTITDKFTVVINTATALDDKTQADGLKLYPLPCNDFLTIEGADAKSQYQIYSLTGQLVQQGLLSGNTEPLDVSSLKIGTYIISVISNNKVSTHKVIKR